MSTILSSKTNALLISLSSNSIKKLPILDKWSKLEVIRKKQGLISSQKFLQEKFQEFDSRYLMKVQTQGHIECILELPKRPSQMLIQGLHDQGFYHMIGASIYSKETLRITKLGKSIFNMKGKMLEQELEILQKFKLIE